MRWIKSLLIVIGVIIVVSVASDIVLAQCPMCKTGLTSSPEGQQMAKGFNNGILFLLSVPFLLVGTIAFLILNARRR